MVEEMWDIVKETEQPVTFPVRAALLRPSWMDLKWLLNQAPDRFTITLWTAGDDWEGATPFDLLYCRNDYYKKSIYYDLPGPQLEVFRQLSVTAGSVLNHFPNMDARDAVHITWAHGVNSRQKLIDALDGEDRRNAMSSVGC